MTQSEKPAHEFERLRPVLTGLAYRITGSLSEAEDVVQDAYISWLKVTHVDDTRRWLMTVCARRSIDVLRSARVARTTYVGPWLPEPFETDYIGGPASTPEDSLELTESVTTAFLLVLERLAPKERAAFVLHDVFDMAYRDVAAAIDASETSCRKLVSRARSNIRRPGKNTPVSVERQRALVEEFTEALRSGDTTRLASHFAKDITLQADSGGKAVAIREPMKGSTRVTQFIAEVLGPAWCKAILTVREINSAPAVVVRQNDRVLAVVSFAFEARTFGCKTHDCKPAASDVFIMRNPDKLARLET